MSSRRNNGGSPVAAERGRGAIENGAGRFYQLDAERLAYWTDGTWMHGTPAVLRGIAHDTRALRPGELYLALIGDRYDGHDFIEIYDGCKYTCTYYACRSLGTYLFE